MGDILSKAGLESLLNERIPDVDGKDIYAEIVRWRMTAEQPRVNLKRANQYFCLDVFTEKNPNEVFVDCGAYDGDTIEQYVKLKSGIFKKIIAFEPDEINFKRMEENLACKWEDWKLSENMFELYSYGVGERSKVVKFERYEENNGVGSKVIEITSGAEGDCKIISLDEFLTEPYSFLKADIESFEYQMLLGAQNGIREYKPKMAICIYHNCVDFYSVPLLIKKMVPEYKIAVRHHMDDLSESVVYAWI